MNIHSIILLVRKLAGRTKDPYQCISNASFLWVNETLMKVHKEQPKDIQFPCYYTPPPPESMKSSLAQHFQERRCCCIPIMTWCKEEKQNGSLVHSPREYSGIGVRNKRWGPRQCRVRRRWIGTEVRNNSLYISNDSLL